MHVGFLLTAAAPCYTDQPFLVRIGLNMSAVFRSILQLLFILTVLPASIPQTTVCDFPLNSTLRLLVKMHHQKFLKITNVFPHCSILPFHYCKYLMKVQVQ